MSGGAEFGWISTVVTVPCSAVTPLRADQVPAVRRQATASPGGSESTPLLAMANTP